MVLGPNLSHPLHQTICSIKHSSHQQRTPQPPHPADEGDIIGAEMMLVGRRWREDIIEPLQEQRWRPNQANRNGDQQGDQNSIQQGLFLLPSLIDQVREQEDHPLGF